MRRALLPLVLISLVALPTNAAAPQEKADVGRLQAEYRDETARARRLRAEAADAAAEIERLERELGALRTAVSADDALIRAQRARLNELGVREATITAELARTRGRQARLLSALQTMSRQPPPPLLVPSDRAVDTVRASILMRAITPGLQTEAKGLVERQMELQRIRRLAALNSEQLFTAESARGDRRAEIESLTARKASLQTVLRAEAANAERAADSLEARLRELGSSAPRIETEAEPAAARLPAGRTRLTAPTEGVPSTRFGPGSSGWRWRANGTEARSPAAARVAYVGDLSGWGRVVILDLGPGWRAVVAGLEETGVEAGARVADGQSLGRAGPDGEIYFELRREDRAIDPAPFLQ